jgi:hypothetical protein
MRHYRHFVVLPLLAGCFASRASRSSDICAQIASGERFNPAEGLELAGTYQLELTSKWEHEHGKTVRGSLDLWTPDSLFQFYEPEYYVKQDTVIRRFVATDSITRWRRTGRWRPLIGAARMDLHKVSAPQSKQLGSRDPFKPGVRLEGANLQFEPVHLGYRRVDGSSMALKIERSSRLGFTGRWVTDGFGDIILKGRKVPHPSGTFCASRAVVTSRKPPNTR